MQSCTLKKPRSCCLFGMSAWRPIDPSAESAFLLWHRKHHKLQRTSKGSRSGSQLHGGCFGQTDRFDSPSWMAQFGSDKPSRVRFQASFQRPIGLNCDWGQGGEGGVWSALVFPPQDQPVRVSLQGPVKAHLQISPLEISWENFCAMKPRTTWAPEPSLPQIA